MNMKMKMYAAASFSIACFAVAAQHHDNCAPDPKPRDPPAVQQPELL